jgi:signal transduction histidine kinase
MTNSKVLPASRRSEKLWLPSLLLLAQFLTITPVLLIVFEDEQQRNASHGYVTLLDGLERLSFAIAELENGSRPDTSWRQQYSDYRNDLNGLLSDSATTPQVRETLARVDSMVARMAKTEETDPLAAGLRKDGQAARSELRNAQRSVQSELSTTGDGIAQRAAYLKALVAGACLLAFGVVFVVRRFRVGAAVERKLQQELRTANEEVIAALTAARSESAAKNHFLTHVSRLIRAPLNSIVDRTEKLLQTELTDRQRDGAHSSLELAESLTRVVDQVVDYSRMESGSLKLQSREFEPAKVVAEALRLFMPSAERKGLKLRSSIKDGLPGVVKGDPERLRQVLICLLSNAVRFTEHGEISLRVEEAPVGEERTGLRFEVRDTGVGIAEQVRSRIFQPFSVFQSAGSEVPQGTGLGLAISKKLVELMGGKIEIASELDRGSSISFTVVFESVRQPTAAALDPMASAGVNALLLSVSAKPPDEKPASEKKQAPDRRAEDRHGINYPTLLRAESAGIAVIRVLDVSASGLRVSVPFRLLPRTEVEIRIEGTSVAGLVRNCTRIAANEFHVGIHIPREASEDEQEHLNRLHMLRIELT